MVARYVKIVLLLLLVGCGRPKYEVGNCVRGEFLTYRIIHITDDFHYVMWNAYGIVRIRYKIVEKAFRKVACEGYN